MTLPDSVRFALWVSAWLRGSESPDAARDAIVGTDAGHDVVGLPGTGDPVPLMLAFGVLRSLGTTHAAAALPVPGDPLGLAGPAEFTLAALDVGEAVLISGAGLGLVPHRVGAGVTWKALPANAERQVPAVAEADQQLRRELVRAVEALAALDVARWRPDAADELMELRRPVDLDVPALLEPRVVRLLSLGSRCRTVVALALADDGGAITAAEASDRRAALAPLDHASRRALVASCEATPPIASSR